MPDCPKCGCGGESDGSGNPEWFVCPECGHQWFDDEYKVSHGSSYGPDRSAEKGFLK